MTKPLVQPLSVFLFLKTNKSINIHEPLHLELRSDRKGFLIPVKRDTRSVS